MKTWLKPLVLLAGVAALAVGLRMLSTHHLASFAALRGPGGQSAFFGLSVAALAFGMPRQIVASAASASYGLWVGVAIALVAQALACVINFFWARFVAHDWAQKRLSGRVAKLNALLAANPFSVTLMLRLFPVGNNLALNLLAGVSSVPPLPFIAASIIGYLPQTLVFALVGTGRSVSLGLGGALFVVSMALGLWLAKRHQELRA